MEITLKKNMHSSLKDSIFYSFMVGLGENFLCAFLLAMGVEEIWAGLVSVVPILLGSILQLYSAYGLKYFGSYKKWVIFCVFVQAATFIPMMVVANIGKAPLWTIFFFVSVYWAASMSASTAWNVWISVLVPEPLRKGFFANRGLYSQVSMLLGLVLGGFILQWGENNGQKLLMFSVLFFVAFASRLFSAYYLTRHSEEKVPEEFLPKFHFRDFFQELRQERVGSLFTFLLIFYVCVHVSAPYFSPFMLTQLHLSYQSYMVLLACAFITKSLAYQLLGTWLKRIPNHHLLVIASLGIITLPYLWVLSSDFTYLCSIQMVSGFFWAIFELANFLLIMELVPNVKRSNILSLYNVFNYVGMFVGAGIGALFLWLKGKNHASYVDLFTVSTFARTVALCLLPKFFFSYHRVYKTEKSSEF